MHKCNDCEKGVVRRGSFCKTCDGIGWLDVDHRQKATEVRGAYSGDEYVVNQEDIDQRIAIYAARARRIKNLALDSKISVDETTSIFYPSDRPAVPPNSCCHMMTIKTIAAAAFHGNSQTEFDDDDFDEDDCLEV